MNKVEVYRRPDRKWGWRLRARNGQVIATDGGQGYDSYSRCTTMATTIVGGAYAVFVVEVEDGEGAS